MKRKEKPNFRDSCKTEENKKISFMDEVAVRLKDKTEFKGIMMQSPENDNRVFIKLDNGYNIGFNPENIEEISILRKASKHNEEETLKKQEGIEQIAMEKDDKKPLITIIHTGGTIASRIDYKTGAVVANFTPKEILSLFPEINSFARIKSIFLANIWSQDIRFSHYNLISKEIKKEIDSGVDGIIVTHGTDTLHYTSAALSFILEDLGVPVILVGSQRSSDRASSDSALNLMNAVFFIARTDFSGVAICMHNSTNDDFCAILPGLKARKMHTSRRDAFKPINSKPIALVDYKKDEIKFLTENYSRKDKKKKVNLKLFDEKVRVAVLKQHTNMFAEEFGFFKNYDGLVIESTGLGNLPISSNDNLTSEHKKIFETLKEMIKNGVVVVLAPQTIYGRINMNVYENQRKQKDIGILGNNIDMTPETTFIKLAWLLSNYSKAEIAKKDLISKNFRGEISERTGLEFDVYDCN
ncbi:MAG: Glu-tRNA(Gln) amidotransferase subunit GatD [Candidatus Woesearchaeota archaeon]